MRQEAAGATRRPFRLAARRRRLRVSGFRGLPRLLQPDSGGSDVFVHISGVERAGMNNLNEGQKVNFELVADKRTGKSSAGNLSAA